MNEYIDKNNNSTKNIVLCYTPKQFLMGTLIRYNAKKLEKLIYSIFI